MAQFKEMLCEQIHGGHDIDRNKIIQLGYSAESTTWLFCITCSRCGKVSVIIRQLLDDILYGQSDKRNPESDNSDEPRLE